MKKLLVAAAVSIACVTAANAQSEASFAVSVLPIASVAFGVSAATTASIAIPSVLLAGGVFVVKGVELSARGTVCVLERASDGARVSVEIAGRGLANASLVAGSMVTATVIGSGVVLATASEAVAFLPNALGRALLHNEQLTY